MSPTWALKRTFVQNGFLRGRVSNRTDGVLALFRDPNAQEQGLWTQPGADPRGRDEDGRSDVRRSATRGC